MSAKHGNLSINSDNIFPIIKKWMYSDHDIFVRELVSNGCDAITKLKKLDGMGEYTLPDDYKAAIQVIVNPDVSHNHEAFVTEWTPGVNDMVLCIMVPDGDGDGFIIGRCQAFSKIGSLGSLVFSVSENTVRTFDELSWKVSAKYATHDRHIKRDVLEFLGPEPGTISFKMAFSVFHGTNPLNEIKKLKRNIRILSLHPQVYWQEFLLPSGM